MKHLALMAGAFLVAASSAQANIGDIDAGIEAIKASAVVLAQPEHVADRIVASAETCVLPMTHLVAIPDDFDGAGGVVVACAAE